MSLTDALITLLIIAFALFAIYDDAILPRRKGPTKLRVALRRRHKIDSGIFIVLLLILKEMDSIQMLQTRLVI